MSLVFEAACGDVYFNVAVFWFRWGPARLPANVPDQQRSDVL